MLRLKKSYRYEWPRPAVTVDVVLFTVAGSLQEMRLQVLLVRRDAEPLRGWWALPGGFVDPAELERLFDAIRPGLIRYPALDPTDFKRKLGQFLAQYRDVTAR